MSEKDIPSDVLEEIVNSKSGCCEACRRDAAIMAWRRAQKEIAGKIGNILLNAALDKRFIIKLELRKLQTALLGGGR